MLTFISTVCLTGQESTELTENGLKWMTYVQSKRSELEIVLIPLTCFNNTWVLKKFNKLQSLASLTAMNITNHQTFWWKRNSPDFCICTVEYGPAQKLTSHNVRSN